MFHALDGRGRIWLLMAFAVLLSSTPPAWTPLLEDMTRRCLDERFQEGDAGRSPKVAQLLLVPLGLAYGKQAKGMPLFEALVAQAASGKEIERSKELLSMLAPIGFYHPDSLLETLRPHLAGLAADKDLRKALTVVLATIRTLHFDLVDAFMEQHLDEALRHDVAVATDVALIDGFMRTLGFFNNAAYQCLFHPRMRQGLSVFPLEVMARAGGTHEFIVAYAAQAIRMARETRFRLLEWRSCAGSSTSTSPSASGR
jgi:hypothetical protein